MVVAKSEAVSGTVVAAVVEPAERSAAGLEHKQAVDRPAENTQVGGKQVVNACVMNTMAASSHVHWNNWIRANDRRNSHQKIDRGIQLRQTLPKSQKIRSIRQPVTVCVCDESWQGLLKVVLL